MDLINLVQFNVYCRCNMLRLYCVLSVCFFWVFLALNLEEMLKFLLNECILNLRILQSYLKEWSRKLNLTDRFLSK